MLWLGDDPERMKVLRDLRDAMSPGQRSRLNSPITARQRVEAILKARQHGPEVEETVEGLAGRAPERADHGAGP